MASDTKRFVCMGSSPEERPFGRIRDQRNRKIDPEGVGRARLNAELAEALTEMRLVADAKCDGRFSASLRCVA